MFCIITNQTEANVWLTSVALYQLLRRLILVTCASSQWRGKKFLIEHVAKRQNVKWQRTWPTIFFFHFFLLKLKILEATVKFAHTWHNFFGKNSGFLQNFRRERTVFHFIFKENRNSEAVFPQVLEDRTLSGTPPTSLL